MMERTFQNPLAQEPHPATLDLGDQLNAPKIAERAGRARSIEEVLEEFDRNEKNELKGYMVQYKPKNESVRQAPAEPSPTPIPKPSLDGIYLPNKKLNVSFLITNAEVLAAAGDYQLAKNVYRTIVQSGDSTWKGLFGLAKCFEAEGKFDEAQAHYEQSIAYHPSYESYISLAKLLSSLKKEKHAAEVLGRALYLKTISIEQRFTLLREGGQSWARAGQADKAEALFLKALELKQNAQDVREYLGNLYLQALRLDEAQQMFQECLTLNAQHARALFGISQCYLQRGEKREAHDALARSLNLELNHPAAVFHLVKCAYEIKSYATAARIVEEYIDIAPVNANLLYSLAGLQYHLGRILDAMATTRRVLDISPNHEGAKELLELAQSQASKSY